jgi:hypothetical protein
MVRGALGTYLKVNGNITITILCVCPSSTNYTHIYIKLNPATFFGYLAGHHQAVYWLQPIKQPTQVAVFILI